MDKPVFRNALALAVVALLGACSGKAALEPAQQSGGNPTLPGPRDFLVPPMQVPTGSWVVNAIDPQGAHFSLMSKTK